MSALEWIAKCGGIAGLIGMVWLAVEALKLRRKTKNQQVDDLACAQEDADRLGLTPLHVDYPTDTGLGVEPGDWRVRWPAAKQRIEREMVTDA